MNYEKLSIAVIVLNSITVYAWNMVLILHSYHINVSTSFHHILGSYHKIISRFLEPLSFSELVGWSGQRRCFPTDFSITLHSMRCFSSKEPQLKVSRDLGLACTQEDILLWKQLIIVIGTCPLLSSLKKLQKHQDHSYLIMADAMLFWFQSN